MLLQQWHWLLTGPVAVKKVACKHSTLWRLLMINIGNACSEAAWHARYCVMQVALFYYTKSALIQELHSAENYTQKHKGTKERDKTGF